MSKTYIRPSSDLRNNYPQLSKLANSDGIVVLTKNGKGDSVLIGIDELDEYQEFKYKKNMNRPSSEKESVQKKRAALLHFVKSMEEIDDEPLEKEDFDELEANRFELSGDIEL